VTREVELGIGLQGDRPMSEYAPLGALAEQLGFAVVTAFADLGFLPPLPILLEVARSTRRVRVGPSCLNPFTNHPVEIASQIAALEDASHGRAYVGLARGAWLDTIGITRRPVSAVRDAAALIGRLLRGEDPGVELRGPLPQRRIPLLIGGWGERIVRLAGEIADELKVGGSANPDLVPVMRRRLGTDRTAMVFGAVTVVDEDRRAARAFAREKVAMYVDVVAGLDPTLEAAPAQIDPEALLDRFAFAGTPADIARQVTALFDAGVKRVEFGAPFGLDAERGLRLLGERVVPEFVRPGRSASPGSRSGA
jgi:5,10-methylenetetrahydromethanopterin reductase